MRRKEIAAFCYRRVQGKLKVVLVTTTAGKWILPKGHPEDDRKDKKVALIEAFEEAGVVGKITGEDIKVDFEWIGNKVTWRVFPVKVEKLKPRWPEAKYRSRREVGIKKASRLLEDPAMAAAVKLLAKEVS